MVSTKSGLKMSEKDKLPSGTLEDYQDHFKTTVRDSGCLESKYKGGLTLLHSTLWSMWE